MMENGEIEIVNKMMENARCDEEREEIGWCIDQVKCGEKTLIEAIEWCGLDARYKDTIKKIKVEKEIGPLPCALATEKTNPKQLNFLLEKSVKYLMECEEEKQEILNALKIIINKFDGNNGD